MSKSFDLPRVLFAAPSSGTGKTTVVCGILEALVRRGMQPASFKCGPDFIDPMFHRRIVGTKSGNLDLYFTDESTVRSLMIRGSQGCKIAVMEGVMGYYDGMSIDSDVGSSYHLARATSTPTVLIIGMRGASLSIAAMAEGFMRFRDDANIKGVILNKCSKRMFETLSGVIERECGVKVLGYVPTDERFAVESRHLGLVTAGEIEDLKQRIGALADTLEETVDLDSLIEIASDAPALQDLPYLTNPVIDNADAKLVKIGVALDNAFCFYYSENLQMLQDMGVELEYFSPLKDSTLPQDISAIYIGGGYPELYAKELASNKNMLKSMKSAIDKGMPLLAECGGFMYLQDEICDLDGKSHKMVGAITGKCKNTGRLSHFGYLDLEILTDCLIASKGTHIRAHEFHYWHSTNEGESFRAVKPSGDSWPCMIATNTLVAGYPHIYFPTHPDVAERIVCAAAEFAKVEGL